MDNTHRKFASLPIQTSAQPVHLGSQAGKRFKVYDREGQPKAAVFLALVKERIDSSAQPRLRLADWRSGDIPVVIDAIAPFGDRDRLMDEFLKELGNSLSERALK